jgi:hypothetical protein
MRTHLHSGNIPPLALAAALGAASMPALADPPQARTIEFVKGRVLVQTRAGLSDKEMDKVLKPHGGKRKGHLKETTSTSSSCPRTPTRSR